MALKTYAIAATMALGATAGSVAAADLTASMWLPQTYAQSKHAYTGMFDRINSNADADLNVEVFFGGSLLPAKTTLEGVGDGAADIGFVYPAYTPAEVPIQAFLNNASFVASDSLVVSLAYTELNFTNADALAEWDKRGVVFTGAYSTPLYYFMCNTPVTTLAEAAGKRMRTAGASFSALADSLGGSAVSVPIGDAYSGMQRGSLECILADPTNLVSASFNEVVTDVTVAPLGVVTGANWVWNKDTWAGLSDAQRALLVDEMALGIVQTQLQFDADTTASFEDAKAKNINIHEPAADLADHLTAFKAQFIADLIANSADVPNAQALFDEYTALQAAWTERLEGVDRTDEAAVLAVVKEHLMSKFSQ